MRLSLYTASRAPSPRSDALVHSLEAAGHQVSASRVQARRLGRDRLVAFPSHGPYTGHGVPFDPGEEPEVLFAATSRVIPDADRAAAMVDGWVSRRPDWPRPERDHAWAVPDHPELSVPVAGPAAERDPWNAHRGTPSPGRHTGLRIGVCFRSTPAGPGHPLKAAMQRAGIEVLAADRIDHTALAGADAVVVVESPDPPLEATGANGGVPVVYWVHHGEHHVDANLRLARRYGVDLVLLAHSWHLALRFDRPVQRFPFAVTPEVAEAGHPFMERHHDAAFVGSLEGQAYGRRRRLIDELERRVDRLAVRTGISPTEMAGLYGDARMVLNDGGTRHLPITMRVFEAVGAGALLLSEPAPGLDLVLGSRYVVLDGEGIGDLPVGDDAAAMAEAARTEALEAHTYDHRVDLLVRFLDGLSHEDRDDAPALGTPLDVFLHSHPHGQRILDTVGMIEAPDREVWRVEDLGDDPPPASFDTVVVDRGADPLMVAAARRFVVGHGLDPDVVEAPIQSVSEIDDLVVVALDSPGYHVDTVGDGRPT